MKQILMTLAAVVCCIITATAQDTAPTDRNRKYTIWLNKVQYVHHQEKMDAGEAVGKILTGALTGKVSVQATKYEDDVKMAIIRGLSGAYRYRFNDGLLPTSEIAEEGNLVVDANITNINAKSDSKTWKDGDKTKVTTWYTGIVEVLLNFKDPKTGEIVANEKFSGWNGQSSNYSTSDEAIKKAIEYMAGNITNWLNKHLPITANIIEGGATKKNKQKEVYIDLGSSEGAFRGLYMGVYTVKRIAGREAKSQIGKLRIEEVEGEDISLCKITSGAKDIKEAIDNGEKLRVISL